MTETSIPPIAKPFMPSRADSKAWDLSSPVADLLKILSSPSTPSKRHDSLSGTPKTPTRRDDDDAGSGTLGDFTKIFEFLGTSAHPVTPSILPLRSAPILRDDNGKATSAMPGAVDQKAEHAERIPLPMKQKTDYTSDGAVYRPPKAKGVRFHDWPVDTGLDDMHHVASNDSGEDTTSTLADPNVEASPVVDKEKRREERKARKRAKKLAKREAKQKDQLEKSVSDVEYSSKAGHGMSKSPARKASVHTVIAEPVVSATPLTTPKKSKSKSKAKVEDEFSSTEAILPEPASPTKKHRERSASPTKKSSHRSSNSITKVNGIKASGHTTDRPNLEPTTPDRPILRQTAASERPVPRPFLTPASVKPPKLQSVGKKPTAFPKSSTQAVPTLSPFIVNPQFHGPSPFNDAAPPNADRPFWQQPSSVPAPLTIRYGTDRHEHFFLELLKQFPNDKKYLLSPTALSNHSTNPDGIHVFVDASNIFVCFYEHLKKLYNIKQGRIEGLQISFDALVLLLERRRPIAKRVVVGSEGASHAFEMAKAIGYETSVLSQVYKDHDLSKRQKKIFYQTSSSGQNSSHHGGYANNAASMGLEIVSGAAPASSHPFGSPMPSRNRPGDSQKWVEQGVDELIHLKMLESIVDADKPSTMVLATGDAAVAEYSGGFFKMVERALKKGWTVEIVAWSLGISRQYRDPAFRRHWGEKFRIVELDDFAEDLIDT